MEIVAVIFQTARSQDPYNPVLTCVRTFVLQHSCANAVLVSFLAIRSVGNSAFRRTASIKTTWRVYFRPAEIYIGVVLWEKQN